MSLSKILNLYKISIKKRYPQKNRLKDAKASWIHENHFSHGIKEYLRFMLIEICLVRGEVKFEFLA